MVKADVDHRHDSHDAVDAMLKLWLPNETLASFRVLRGGYSGTNYLVQTESGQSHVIKIAHGYDAPDVEKQAMIGAFLRNQGFLKCCYPTVASRGVPGLQYVAMVDPSEAALLMNYIPGRAGDYLVENHLIDHKAALFQVGLNLAQLHQVPVSGDEAKTLRTHHEDGLCFLFKHLEGTVFELFSNTTDEFVKNHDFVKFYLARHDSFLECLRGLDCGRQSVVHGDPFLDNILFDESSGSFLGFVDFEDACVGPSIMDLACCCVGNCFRTDEISNQQLFDADLFKCLLDGYRAGFKGHHDTSPVIDAEIKSLMAESLKAALMLNASWRFQNFNITFPHMCETHGKKYLELQERIELLERTDILALI